MTILSLKTENWSDFPSEMRLFVDFIDDCPRPFILICPGGGYNHLALEKEGTTIATWLKKLGYHVGILAYPVQKIVADTFLKDLENIMTELRDQAAIAQLFVMGFSAGGHVAGLTGTKITTKPDGLLLCYPVITFCSPYGHEGSAQNFLGKTLDETTRQSFSIDQNVSSDTPSCFIWHTMADQSVPVENSLLLAHALHQQNISCELHLFPEGRHGLALLNEVPHTLQWQSLAENWLTEMTKRGNEK